MKHGLNTDTEKTMNRREQRGWVNRETRETRERIVRGEKAEAGALRRMPTAWMNSTAAAGLRHSRAPGKSRGRCGKRPYRASGRVVRCGKRRYASGAFTGLRDQEIGKWCSFSHLETALTRLFPHKSTQVVDFPHLGYVRLFREGVNNRRGAGTQRQAKLASKVGRVN